MGSFFPWFTLLVSFSDTLLVVSILGIAYDIVIDIVYVFETAFAVLGY